MSDCKFRIGMWYFEIHNQSYCCKVLYALWLLFVDSPREVQEKKLLCPVMKGARFLSEQGPIVPSFLSTSTSCAGYM
jgi:hypothetical protein